MDKEIFAKSGICESKIKEILANSSLKNIRAYRVIKHNKNLPIVCSDFIPTFIERNKNVIPPLNKQENYKISKFGVSMYDSEDHIKKAQQLIPSLRTYPVAEGRTDLSKGSVGEPDMNGHFQYFLFNYTENSPFIDFKYL